MGDEGVPGDNLTAVMESMGIYDTDLRAHGNAGAPAANETQRLLKILLATLNKAVAQGSVSAPPNPGEPSTGSGEPAAPEPEPKKPNEPACQTNYTEVRRGARDRTRVFSATRWTFSGRASSVKDLNVTAFLLCSSVFRRTWTAALPVP